VDFVEAVAQHLAWKQRLRRILLGRERRRKPERTEAIEAQCCPLDEWIKSAAKHYGQDMLFKNVEEQHRLSHELAIQMVLDEESAKTSMEMVFQIGKFHICSRNLLESLEQLRRKHALSEIPLCVIPSGFPREEFPPVLDARA
jgi:hypothetical protein